MEDNRSKIERDWIEQKLSQIGAKVADATDLSHRARELAARAEQALISAQQEIERLYTSLGEEWPQP